MNCSIAVFSIGDIWQGDIFPEDFVKEIKNKKLDSEFVFCQKREGDLMYYSWSWRNEKINRSIFACYNGFMIDLNEKECFRKIASDLQYIALGDWKTVLPKAQNYLRTSIKLIPLPILSYEKPARKKTFPKFDANELSKYTDTNSTAFVSKTGISEQDKVNPLLLFVILLTISVTIIVCIFVYISSQEKTQQIIPERNIDRPIHHTPFQEENYLPASPRTEPNVRKQVEKSVDKKTQTAAPIAESHENSTILQNKRFRTELQESINEWNKSLPIEVEDGIRWVFTSVQGSFCVLHYRVSYEDEEDFEGLISEVRENIKANIKSADKDMVEFLQALYRNGFGVKVQFRLRNTDRTIVIAIDARELKSIIER